MPATDGKPVWLRSVEYSVSVNVQRDPFQMRSTSEIAEMASHESPFPSLAPSVKQTCSVWPQTEKMDAVLSIVPGQDI